MHYRQIACFSLHGRILLFFATLLVMWAPLAFCSYGLGHLLGQQHIASIFSLILLYGCFIGLAWVWGRWIHDWRQPFKVYGWNFCDRFLKDALAALFCGLCLVASLFGIKVLLGWASWHPRPIVPIVLEGLMVALGIGIAEELLFRGWLLAELQTSLSRGQAIIWSSGLFAVAHFIKPLPDILNTSPQFLGLFLLGLILASSRCISRLQRTPFHSLGLPIGLHAGLVWGYYIVDVADLALPSGRVPEWVTGIHGNPLSGILGLIILTCLTVLAFFRLRST